MRILLLLLVAAVFPFESQAQAQVEEGPTGNDLLPECVALMDVNQHFQKGEQTPASQNVKAMGCLSYVGGVVDSNLLHGLVEGTALFCPPPGSDLMQAAAVVTRYLEEHPEKRHQGRALLVHAALIQAFPCESGSE